MNKLMVITFILMFSVIGLVIYSYEEHPVSSGKISKVDYLSGSFGSSSRTIVTFDDGNKCIIIGIYAVKLGAEATCLANNISDSYHLQIGDKRL